MATHSLSISEARRLLPELVHRLAAEGGRVDVTCRGKPTVTLLRTSDVDRAARRATKDGGIPPELRIALAIDPDDVEVRIAALRSGSAKSRRSFVR